MGIVKAFLRRENWEGAGDRGRAVPVLSIFCRKTARIFIDDLPKSLFSLTFFIDSRILNAGVLLLVDPAFFLKVGFGLIVERHSSWTRLRCVPPWIISNGLVPERGETL